MTLHPKRLLDIRVSRLAGLNITWIPGILHLQAAELYVIFNLLALEVDIFPQMWELVHHAQPMMRPKWDVEPNIIIITSYFTRTGGSTI